MIHASALAAATTIALQVVASSNLDGARGAENALVAALQKHDRAAFEQIVAADAVFHLPGLFTGREAIVKAWLPFLIDAGVTLVLTPDPAAGHASGDLAYTHGTFAFSGNTNRGPGTVNAGSYLAVWKREGDAWLLHAFSGASPPAARVTAASGFQDYKFGMTRAQVQQVAGCQPYMQVPSTSGLECPNFTFEGRKMNISFIFAGDALTRVQLWYYEGDSEEDAKAATDALLEYLRRAFSAVHSYDLPPGSQTNSETIFKVLKDANVAPNQAARVQIQTGGGPYQAVAFASVIRHPGGYFVFLYFNAPASPR